VAADWPAVAHDLAAAPAHVPVAAIVRTSATCRLLVVGPAPVRQHVLAAETLPVAERAPAETFPAVAVDLAEISAVAAVPAGTSPVVVAGPQPVNSTTFSACLAPAAAVAADSTVLEHGRVAAPMRRTISCITGHRPVPAEDPASAILPVVACDPAPGAVEYKLFPVTSDLAPVVAEFNAPVVEIIDPGVALVPAKVAAAFNDPRARVKVAAAPAPAAVATAFGLAAPAKTAAAFAPIAPVAATVLVVLATTRAPRALAKAAAASNGGPATTIGPTIDPATSTTGTNGTTGGTTITSASTTIGTTIGATIGTTATIGLTITGGIASRTTPGVIR
jgi:hypothetical protein